jgi:cystathionine beta-lyase/cystathionine gamma-synthase
MSEICFYLLVQTSIWIMSEEGFLQQEPGFATKAIHVGQEPEQWNSSAVIPPITLSTTFKQEAPAKHKVSTTVHRYCSSF